MSKPIAAILAIGAALTIVLAGCVTSTELQSDGSVEDAEFPEWLDDDGMLPSIDLTLLGEEGEMTAYSSRDDEDNWCVIAVLSPSPEEHGYGWSASHVCVPPEAFATEGAAVSVGGGGRSGGAHLLPPGYSEPLEAGWVQVSPRLAVKR
ncbi:hypothetical protein [Salinibacterium sp. PAMC 21357]|uniref:hypothetical protein n=1 Tax=Salinibacterium sp. PAMC 21357 TaxID=1112215 RepID=UPI00028A2F39|nr:hypothetical protein [Salinibacterium sp. PAMC 21357]